MGEQSVLLSLVGRFSYYLVNLNTNLGVISSDIVLVNFMREFQES